MGMPVLLLARGTHQESQKKAWVRRASTVAKLCASLSCGGDLSLAYKVQGLLQKAYLQYILRCLCVKSCKQREWNPPKEVQHLWGQAGTAGQCVLAILYQINKNLG